MGVMITSKFASPYPVLSYSLGTDIWFSNERGVSFSLVIKIGTPYALNLNRMRCKLLVVLIGTSYILKSRRKVSYWLASEETIKLGTFYVCGCGGFRLIKPGSKYPPNPSSLIRLQ